MRLNLKEFVIVRNEKGELNLDSLKVTQAQKKDRKPTEEAEEKPAPEIQLDRLELSIGKVVFKDYSRGGEPSVKEYNLNIRESHENITDLNVLVNLIVAKALTKAALAGLTQVNLSDIQGTLGGTLSSAQQLAVLGTSEARETVKETTTSLKEKAQALKEKFKVF